MSNKDRLAARDAYGEVSVKNISTLDSTYLHRADPSCKPQHDLDAFRDSYVNLTGIVGHDSCNLNTVASSAVHSGTVRSHENVVQHQLSSARFSTTSLHLSSMSGGVVYDAFPHPATALIALPASSRSQSLSSHSELMTTAVTAVEVLKQPESSQSSLLHTMIPDRGRLLPLAPAKIQAGAMTSAHFPSKAFDVYEFRDEDDNEFAGVGIGFRRGKPSGSSVCSPQTNQMCLAQPRNVGDLTLKCQSASETDAGMMSSVQNVATLLDMDSKSICRISLPVKPEPVFLDSSQSHSMPLTVTGDMSVPVVSVQNESVPVEHRKHRMPSSDVNYKRVRLNNSTNNYLGFENVGTNSRLPNIPDSSLNVRKMSECSSTMMTSYNWPEKSCLSQPVNFTPPSQCLSPTFGNVSYPDHVTLGYTTVKLVDLSAEHHVTRASCSEVVNSKTEPISSLPSVATQSTRDRHMWLFNGNAAGAPANTYSIMASKPVPVSGQTVYPMHAGSEYHRYGVHQQNSMPVSQQPGCRRQERNKYESDIEWCHIAKTNHSTAVQPNSDEKNTFRNVSLEGCKKHDTTSENLQHDALSYVLDLSCNNSRMLSVSAASQIAHCSSFYPNLPPAAATSRSSDNQVRQRVTDSLPPRLSSDSNHHHQQQQQQQQWAFGVKKEDVEDRRMLMTDEEKLMNRLKCNLIEEVPHCQCRGSYNESTEGPYYSHLGVGPTEAAIRQLIEQRLDVHGAALRIEKLLYTGKEGKSIQGCPIAKWIIRRSGPEEKVLVLTRRRRGHHCQHAVMIVGICVWDGVDENYATELYDYLRHLLPDNGEPTERRCGWNERKTCACQGWNEVTGGASFSFGCSWSMYYNACKFARSDAPRKFRLRDHSKEARLDHLLQSLATHVAPIYQRVAPDSYNNQIHFENEGSSCRIGDKPGRPWSGVTAVVDFCTHSHKDTNNMNNGCTTVLTLTKHRGHRRPDDEQLHVLPLCILDSTDEFGNAEGQHRKITSGSIECLREFPMTTRLHRQPVLCKRKRLKMAALARAAAGIVSRRGRGRGKSSLGLAAANALRVATHCRMVSSVRGCRPRHLHRAVTKFQNLPDGPFAPNWTQAAAAGLSCHQARDEVMSNCINDFKHAHSGKLQFTAPAPRTSPATESFLQIESCPPPSYGSLFPSRSSDARSMHDVGVKSSIANGCHQGLLYGSANMSPTYAYNQSLQSLEHRHSQHTSLEQYSDGSRTELPSYLNQRAGYSAIQPDVHEHHGSIQQHLAFVSRAVSASTQLPHSETGHLPHRSTSMYSFRQYGIPGHSELCYNTSAAPVANTYKFENQSVAQQPTLGSNVHAYDCQDGSRSASHSMCKPKLLSYAAPTESSLQPLGLSNQNDRPTGSQLDTGTHLGTKQISVSPSSYLSTAENHTPVGCFSSDERNWHFPLEMLSDVAQCRPKLPEIGSVFCQMSVGKLSPVNVQHSDLLSYPHSVKADANSSSRLMTPLQQLPAQPTTAAADVASSQNIDKGGAEDAAPLEIFYDNAENFSDSEIGGVALALTHGSILFEVAKRELHATTALKNPNRSEPTRISLVFYQHRNLNAANHGRRQFELRSADRHQKQHDGAVIGTSRNSEPTPLITDLCLLQDSAGVVSSQTHTQFTIDEHLLRDTARDNVHSDMQSSVDCHLPLKTPAVDFGNFGTENVEISTHGVPTTDELAEINLSQTHTQFTTGGHLLQDTARDNIHGHVESSVDLSQKTPAANFGNFGTENVEVSTHRVPTTDELAEIDLSEH